MSAGFRSALFYQDPKAALAWLEEAFGFELVMLLEDADGNVAHSQMEFGDSYVMIGQEWSADHKSPKSVGGKNTQTVHVQIDSDVDAHFARAKAAGAEIMPSRRRNSTATGPIAAAILRDTSGRCRRPWPA